PSLGRYCVFGNLFARAGSESNAFRLDRHPSMSRHPVTPMNEADLLLHLAKQTTRKIGLLDVIHIQEGLDDAAAQLDVLCQQNEIVLIDLLYDSQLPTIGALLERCQEPAFVVGSSDVEASLAAWWQC